MSISTAEEVDKRTHSYDRDTLRFFYDASVQHKRLVALSLLFPLGTISLNAVLPLFVGKMLAALGQHGDPLRLLPWFVAVGVFGLFANRFGFIATLTLQARAMSILQARSLDILLRRSVGFHSNNIGGKLVSDAIDFTQSYGMLTNAFFVNLLPFSFTLLAGTLLVFTESWQLGLLVLAMAVYALGSAYRESRQREPLRINRLKATKAVTGHLADTVLNVQTVKTFANEKSELQEHGRLNGRLLDLRMTDWRSAAIQGNNRIAVLLVMQLIFILLVVHLVQQNPALLGIGLFAFSFVITLNNRLFQVNEMLRNIEDGLLQASPMMEIMRTTPEIQDVAKAKKLKVRGGTIDFNHVTFQYEDTASHDTVFSKLDLHIKSGERIGLVGPSGGGKTTLTRLLLRFDDIDDGTISIDGQDITRITQTSLRQAISYVPQEPLLFHRSIKDNIAYGSPAASADDVIKAAKKASAHGFITKLPQGYETIVGERGIKLSGGQRQRIAISRAILKDAPILVLDEATSALDSESEKAIQSALWELMEQRTAIVVAHRLSTIQRLDRIIVLDDGQILEQGSHAELLKQRGLYAKLWSHQSGGFMED